MSVDIPIEPLVGGAGTQTTELRFVTADFHVVEKVGIARQNVVTGIPRHLQLGVLMHMLSQSGHIFGLPVTSHEADTRNLPSVFRQQTVQRILVQDLSDVQMQMRTMTAHAPMRTVGDIHREGHLIGNLLEDDIVVVVF